MMVDEKKLSIEQKIEGNVLTCTLKGWLDPNTSPELLKQVDINAVEKLVVDMHGVEYVFSAGLRAFMQLQRVLDEKGGTLLLVNVPDTIRSIFEYTGLEGMLEAKS